MNSPMKRFIFISTLFIIPFLILAIFEITLRITNFGTEYPLYFKKNGYYFINSKYPQKFFGRFDSSAPELIEQKIPVPKPPNTMRLICLGGSTTAGFPYEININFPAFLKCGLQQQFPEKKWQVINLGVSALNSHGVRHMSREILELKPDLILIYMGHNEFYGVFGLASARGHLSNPTVVQWFLKLKTLRIYQLLESLIYRLSPGPKAQKATLMARMIQNNKVLYGSPLYQKTLKNFETNLNEILNFFQQQNIPVILSPLVSNLKDQQPLGAPPPQKSGMNLDRIRELIQQNDFVQAKNLLHTALQEQPNNAQLHFLMGQVYYSLKNFRAAKKHFIVARDYDQVPFRAPSGINQIIFKLAQKRSVPLAPTDSLFSAFSPHGIWDGNLFLEHLHPNEKGYQLLARAFARPVVRQLLKSKTTINLSACQNFSDLDLAIGQLKIEHLVSNAPFFGRTHFKARRFQPPLIEQIAQRHLRRELLWDASHFELADYYLQSKNYAQALKEYRIVLAYDSPHLTALYKLADTYFQMAKLDSAYYWYQKALHFHPRTAFVQAKLARLLLVSGNVKQAINVINQIVGERALFEQLNPRQQNALYYLRAVAFLKLGKKTAAKDKLKMLLQRDPDNSLAKKLWKKLKQED